MFPGCTMKSLEPRVGVEPTTCRLRIGCSTTELPRHPVEKTGLVYWTLPFHCKIIASSVSFGKFFAERIHRAHLQFARALDVQALSQADVGMAHDGLNVPVLYAESMKVSSQAAAESMPTVPER